MAAQMLWMVQQRVALTTDRPSWCGEWQGRRAGKPGQPTKMEQRRARWHSVGPLGSDLRPNTIATKWVGAFLMYEN